MLGAAGTARADTFGCCLIKGTPPVTDRALRTNDEASCQTYGGIFYLGKVPNSEGTACVDSPVPPYDYNDPNNHNSTSSSGQPAPGATSGQASILGRLRNAVSGAYDSSTDENTMSRVAGLVVNVVFSILGVIFVFLIVYAGYQWMTAQGDKIKVTKGQSVIRTCVIGMLVTAGAYAIWQFIFFNLIAR